MIEIGLLCVPSLSHICSLPQTYIIQQWSMRIYTLNRFMDLINYTSVPNHWRMY